MTFARGKQNDLRVTIPSHFEFCRHPTVAPPTTHAHTNWRSRARRALKSQTSYETHVKVNNSAGSSPGISFTEILVRIFTRWLLSNINVKVNHSASCETPCLMVNILLAGCYNAFVDSECERLAQLGSCESDRQWMLDNCFKTCSGCYIPGNKNKLPIGSPQLKSPSPYVA